MNVQGPMARRVADVRLGLQVLMGAHPRDPWSIDAPFAGPPMARPIRVAVVPTPPGGSVDPVVSAVVRRAADTLADAGYDVVEDLPAALRRGSRGLGRLHHGRLRLRPEPVQPADGAPTVSPF